MPLRHVRGDFSLRFPREETGCPTTVAAGGDPVPYENIGDFDTFMGHEIALQIRNTREEGRKLVLVLAVSSI